MENLDKESRYFQAKEQVRELKKFYGSLMSYVLVIGGLAALNYYTNELRYPWFLWPAFGWGIGLLFHAAKAFNWNPIVSKDWEERKIKEFMDREDKSQSTMGRWE
ncbi:2TM domain-containing protein [Leeuwenhoekiella aequorea]|uniref:2TM domain-containing protein n=1 Tax=Leeuwenhoekiella aequorea TaxID=283736 RepID=A0A4Q0PBL6_9FLAO|nr:2TM domain-containing protein [Leeuwenhoekiella aequorea]RXG23756.1 2TM domain-containing protein [Leeuwenhoekiella aequorea]